VVFVLAFRVCVCVACVCVCVFFSGCVAVFAGVCVRGFLLRISFRLFQLRFGNGLPAEGGLGFSFRLRFPFSAWRRPLAEDKRLYVALIFRFASLVLGQTLVGSSAFGLRLCFRCVRPTGACEAWL
jgi:hypothetical protein